MIVNGKRTRDRREHVTFDELSSRWRYAEAFRAVRFRSPMKIFDDTDERDEVHIEETGIDFGTHGNVWPGGLCWSRFRRSTRFREMTRGRRKILELGSGTGIGGLTCCLDPNIESVLLTDLPVAMEALKRNVCAFEKRRGRRGVRTCSLRMGDADNAGHDVARQFDADVVLAADTMYNTHMIHVTCTSLRRLVPFDESSKTRFVWLVYVDRTVRGDDTPLHQLRRAGFDCVRRTDLMTLQCCRSLLDDDANEYLEDVRVWLWECRRAREGIDWEASKVP